MVVRKETPARNVEEGWHIPKFEGSGKNVIYTKQVHLLLGDSL